MTDPKRQALELYCELSLAVVREDQDATYAALRKLASASDAMLWHCAGLMVLVTRVGRERHPSVDAEIVEGMDNMTADNIEPHIADLERTPKH